jgi:hypothetical protein
MSLPANEPEKDRSEYNYEFSGIRERVGKVNGWLIALYVALTIWGVWYLVEYWTKS